MMTQFAVLAARLAGVGRRAPVLAVLAGLTASQWPSATASYAQRRTERRQTEEWVLLSSREIDRKGSQETIDVRAARGQVKAVRLIARRNALELTQIKVTYGDGRVHDENRNINLNPNDRTRPIESGGTEHFVDAIELAVLGSVDGHRREALLSRLTEVPGLMQDEG
mgnify:CR=1 FL=1